MANARMAVIVRQHVILDGNDRAHPAGTRRYRLASNGGHGRATLARRGLLRRMK